MELVVDWSSEEDFRLASKRSPAVQSLFHLEGNSEELCLLRLRRPDLCIRWYSVLGKVWDLELH